MTAEHARADEPSTGDRSSPARRFRPPTAGRSARTRSSSHERGPLHRVVAARAPLAPQAAAVRPRRARRLVGLGALPRLLRGARLGGPRAQPAQPLLVADRRPDELTFDTYVDDVVAAHRAARRRRSSWSATGWAACWPSRPPSGAPVGGLVLVAPELPRSCARRPEPHELREVPDVYGRVVIGWETLPEKLQREHRDLTLADVLRIQHLLGQKPHESGAARRQMLAGRAGRPRAPSPRSRGWSSAAGSTGMSPSPTASAWPTWLGAEYEPFGAHSHYGLVVGEAEPRSRSPTRSGASSRPTACSRRGGDDRRSLVSSRPVRRSSHRAVGAAFV